MDQRELAVITRLLGSDIKKPTALVHFQRQMSQVAQRIMTLLIFNAQETEPDAKGLYEARVKFVHDFLGWTDSKNYERIYEAFREIKSNDIVWNFLGEDRTLDELRCSFLITLGISRRSGAIRYKFHPELLPIIRNPSVFAKLKLIMLAVLAHPKYAYPLYEFVADSFCRGKPVERISLVKLKDFLGIPPTSYTDYVTFKDQVLKPSIAALNRISDYAVTYTTYREGRKVAGVILHIERKTQWQQPLLFEKPLAVLQRFFGVEPVASAPSLDEAGVAAFIASLGRHTIDERTARNAVAAHGLTGATEIRDKVLAEVERRKAGANPVHDLPAYLARCLREGFGKKTAAERQAAAETAEACAAREREKTLRQQAEEAEAAAQAARKRDLTARLAAMPAAELEALRAAFVAEVEAGKYADTFTADFRLRGWKASGAEGLFRVFVAKKLDHV
ncbi:MAG: replication initiation protein [Phaeospirillum sp.]|nr:replication initiation protein [Phaeospirillum sp.]